MKTPEDLCLDASRAWAAGDDAAGDALWDAAKAADRERGGGSMLDRYGLTHFFVGVLHGTIMRLRDEHGFSVKRLEREAAILREQLAEEVES